MKNLNLRIGVLYGVITSAISVLISLALMFTGLADFSGGSNGMVSFLILGLGIYLASDAYKKLNDGFMSAGQVVSVSAWLGLVMGFISGVFFTIYLKYIDTETVDKTLRMVRFQMEEDGQMSDKQIKEAVAITRKAFEFPWMLIMSVIFNTIFSVIVGFILGIFLKREKPFFE